MMGTILGIMIFTHIGQGYVSLRLDASSADGLGESCLGLSYLALPLPLFFPFKALSTVVDWKTSTLEVLPGFWEYSKEEKVQ